MAREREQQASLALEEAELQKTALQAEAENKAKELLLELETARTVSLSVVTSPPTQSFLLMGSSEAPMRI